MLDQLSGARHSARARLETMNSRLDCKASMIALLRLVSALGPVYVVQNWGSQ